MGHYIRGSWLAETVKPPFIELSGWLRSLALTDIAEVYAADCIIMDVDGASTTGGRYVEWGVACAPGTSKVKWIVGNVDPNAVFLSLADRQFNNWDELIKYLEENREVFESRPT